MTRRKKILHYRNGRKKWFIYIYIEEEEKKLI